MRPLASREPGPIAQALESTDAWYGLIVDGVHVDPAMLRLALRGLGRPLLVTDAMPPIGGNRSSFTLHGENITVRDGRCLTDEGTLAGTVLDMATALNRTACWRYLPHRAITLHGKPATFIGLEHMPASFSGYRVDLVAFDPNNMTVLLTCMAAAIVDLLQCYHPVKSQRGSGRGPAPIRKSTFDHKTSGFVKITTVGAYQWGAGKIWNYK
jgi:N-acetylglucosamine-6-phosphate deacetylase